jgi:hypothetical protein
MILLLAQRAIAQSTNNAWLATFYTVKFNNKFSLLADAQFRTGDNYSTMQTLLLRAGLQYQVSKKVGITAGYAYILPRRTVQGVQGYGEENRLWEQVLVQQSIGFASAQHRFRLEQRFISKSVVEDGSLKNEGNVYSNRFRYFFRTIIPFSGKKSFQQGMFGAVQNEVMLQFGDKSSTNGKTFDQNRFYLAVGYRFSRRFDLEGGYMYQYVEGRGDVSSNHHIIQLAGYFRL